MLYKTSFVLDINKCVVLIMYEINFTSDELTSLNCVLEIYRDEYSCGVFDKDINSIIDKLNACTQKKK